jgi:hypothetical protein
MSVVHRECPDGPKRFKDADVQSREHKGDAEDQKDEIQMAIFLQWVQRCGYGIGKQRKQVGGE